MNEYYQPKPTGEMDRCPICRAEPAYGVCFHHGLIGSFFKDGVSAFYAGRWLHLKQEELLELKASRGKSVYDMHLVKLGFVDTVSNWISAEGENFLRHIGK